MGGVGGGDLRYLSVLTIDRAKAGAIPRRQIVGQDTWTTFVKRDERFGYLAAAVDKMVLGYTDCHRWRQLAKLQHLCQLRRRSVTACDCFCLPADAIFEGCKSRQPRSPLV